MESNRIFESGNKSSTGAKGESDIITARAIMTCPNCGWKKVFKNQFYRKDIEMMVVSLKVFDWLTCPKCGELIDLNLEYDI
ncbi:MAG: hypothetical protein ACP6IY_00220 [Promethearchaeia archaeon]